MLKRFFLFLSLAVTACNQPMPQQSGNYSDTVKNSDPSSATVAMESQYCNQLAEEILKSSAQYKKLTEGLLEAVRKNGGTSVSIFMEKSPEAEMNSFAYSPRFEMQVNENYPDRKVNIGRFVFDPAKDLLYEYDVISDSLITIQFDTGLLAQSGKYCR